MEKKCGVGIGMLNVGIRSVFFVVVEMLLPVLMTFLRDRSVVHHKVSIERFEVVVVMAKICAYLRPVWSLPILGEV